jgi:hypothetical protein
MKDLHEQQSADELQTLTEAEVEIVSGGAKDWGVDLGPLGSFEFWICTKYTLGDEQSSVTFVQC